MAGLLRWLAMCHFLTWVTGVFSLQLFTKLCMYYFGLLYLHFILQEKVKNAILILSISLKKENRDSFCNENTLIAVVLKIQM